MDRQTKIKELKTLYAVLAGLYRDGSLEADELAEGDDLQPTWPTENTRRIGEVTRQINELRAELGMPTQE